MIHLSILYVIIVAAVFFWIGVLFATNSDEVPFTPIAGFIGLLITCGALVILAVALTSGLMHVIGK